MPRRVLRCCVRARRCRVAMCSQRRLEELRARELMERVLAEAAGDIPVDSSYDDICKFILLNTVSVNTSRHYSFKFCD